MGRKYCVLFILLLTGTLRLAAQSYLEFVENKGQWDSQVKFQGQLGQSGSFYLEKNGFKVLLHNPEDMKRLMDSHHNPTGIHRPDRGPVGILTQQNQQAPGEGIVVHSHAYQMQFTGGSADPQIVPDKKIQTVNNYFIGNDPSKWASNCNVYQAVTYKNVYPNIDVRYYVENGRLKYDLLVYPGGDASRITMNYAGVDKLSVKNGELIIKTSVGETKELAPYAYQFMPTGKTTVDCKYQISGNVVKFNIKNYDKNTVLVIDPTLIFSTLTFSATDNWGFTATPGPDGSLFSGSIAFGDKYPVTPGAFQTYHNPQNGSKKIDIAITRFSPDATYRIYSTYLGGNNDDYPHSLISDPQGNLVVMGRSYSTDFPGTVVGPGGGADIVVTKLNSTGTGIIGSLRIGGKGGDGYNIEDEQQSGNDVPKSLIRNYGDDSRSEVILDSSGNIYVAAQSQSNDFPIRGTSFQPSLAGAQDGVVMKINPSCTAVTWSSYLGGSQDDGAFVIALDPFNNDLYVAGGTASTNFPGVQAGVIQTSNAGAIDAFVSIIANDGSVIRKSTYLGTAQIDIIYGIQFDKKGFPYIMGVTRGTWPVINAAYSNAGSKQFIGKLEPDLTAYIYSTVFGSGDAKPNMSPVAFLVDRCENVYISGWGGWLAPAESGSSDPYDMAGVFGMPVTADAIKSTTDNKDFYFFVLKKNATGILYGSFFGQTGGYGEHVDGGTSRFDQQGVIYQAICANCGGGLGGQFPVTPNVVGPYNPGPGCNLAAVKIAFNFAGVNAGPKPFIHQSPRSQGCIPMTVDFRDTVLSAKSYEWDFDGDGVTDAVTTSPTASYTYNAVGTYRVRLIGVDSASCNVRDTAYTTVRARNDEAILGFNYAKVGPCESTEFQFTNSSISPPGKPFTGQSFIWDFGDNSPKVITGALPLNHTFPGPGNYTVRLILNDTSYCNAPDTLPHEIRIAPLVKAAFTTPPAGCAPYNAVFNNTSTAGQDFFWDFGDGTTSTETDPIHLYANTGTYTITLRAVDTSTCNKTDQTQFTITVNSKPQAAFTVTPVPAEENKPTIFTNGSLGASKFNWLFGDGTSRIKNSMDTVIHQYNKTGTFQACLVAINNFGCADTTCQPVQAIINPVLDVPNAFTPGRPGARGKNNIVKPEGFGIGKVLFTIYNRWGQKLFETTDPNQGWDGRFKGVLQPMDVYVYTLQVEFTDGTKASRKGDITLIR